MAQNENIGGMNADDDDNDRQPGRNDTVEIDPYPASRDEYQARLADFTSQEKRRFDTIKSLSAYLWEIKHQKK